MKVDWADIRVEQLHNSHPFGFDDIDREIIAAMLRVAWAEGLIDAARAIETHSATRGKSLKNYARLVAEALRSLAKSGKQA